MVAHAFNFSTLINGKSEPIELFISDLILLADLVFSRSFLCETYQKTLESYFISLFCILN